MSGVPLGRVLASLARAEEAPRIIDPMCGSGDLLAACLELGAKPDRLVGVEIDAIAHDQCVARLGHIGTFHRRNAFAPSTWRLEPPGGWDLVIANPPYVRYQATNSTQMPARGLPNATDVRRQLAHSLKLMTALDEQDRQLFGTLIEAYSGLADLAVPSWLLCASLVKVGGRLALVLPESWLSRDYAWVVRYVLGRLFEVEYIVEDEHACWFPTAQVKTMLLVAKRVPRRQSAWLRSTRTYAYSKIGASAMGAGSPIGSMFADSPEPERTLRETIDIGVREPARGLIVQRRRVDHISAEIASLRAAQPWFGLLEDAPPASQRETLPHPLYEWIGRDGAACLAPLESIGVSIGQGLRTGANDFFYVTLMSEGKDVSRVRSSDIRWLEPIVVPNCCLRAVVRRQTDLGSSFSVSSAELKSRVLDLSSVALPSDRTKGGRLAQRAYGSMEPALAKFVRWAATAPARPGQLGATFPELTAVAPNVRPASPDRNLPPRYWYMLPPFTDRHMPDVAMARVNSAQARPVALLEKGIVADANFSTFSIHHGKGMTRSTLVALLQSDWCQAWLEHTASVMGGGALKVEAAHLRRLLVPRFDVSSLNRLTVLGDALILGKPVGRKINEVVASAVLGRRASLQKLGELRALVEGARQRRARQRQSHSLASDKADLSLLTQSVDVSG